MLLSLGFDYVEAVVFLIRRIQLPMLF